ncbi:hypothetical protein COY27_02425 [Candidatus Woesearchaeota archaeon CG_4_10_14_0_2_um_filter_33_13]|nr:MAG: hypothetical protein COY27_02425 [Candidatus Woesearchaeota archaeon CG_4_10_14_0_2_um_filter_33_13]
MINEMNYERFLIINGRELNYKGIFRIDELYSTINRAIEEQGYEKREKRSEETVREEGRHVYVELRPWKEVTKYLTLMIKLKIIMDNVTEEVTTINNQKRVFQKGDLTIVFDGWILTDYQDRWGMRPFFYFVKGMLNKYVWKNPIESNIFGQLAGDVAHVYAKIKKHLNSFMETSAKEMLSEEEILKQVEEELKKEVELAKKEGISN